MKLPSLALLILAMTQSACVTRDIDVAARFDPQSAAYVLRSGSGTITGQGFMRQNGGGVVTCAGEEVNLFPATAYATERLTKIYGNPNGGRISVYQGASDKGLPPDYLKYRRTALCDAEGDFEFQNVAPGAYYVITRVIWTVGTYEIPEGGGLAKRITLRSGQKLRVLLN